MGKVKGGSAIVISLRSLVLRRSYLPIDADACFRRHDIPASLDWVATKDVDKDARKRVCDRKAEDAPNSIDDGLGWEDAKVEQQDAAFCKTGSSTEKDGGQQIFL